MCGGVLLCCSIASLYCRDSIGTESIHQADSPTKNVKRQRHELAVQLITTSIPAGQEEINPGRKSTVRSGSDSSLYLYIYIYKEEKKEGKKKISIEFFSFCCFILFYFISFYFSVFLFSNQTKSNEEAEISRRG